MKRYLIIGYIALLTMTSSLSFNLQKTNPSRVIRANYLITRRRIRNSSIPKATKKYIDNTMSIIQDDIVNDVLYLFKFYNLSNDTLNSYTYIFMYEFISYIETHLGNVE